MGNEVVQGIPHTLTELPVYYIYKSGTFKCCKCTETVASVLRLFPVDWCLQVGMIIVYTAESILELPNPDSKKVANIIIIIHMQNEVINILIS